MSLFTRAVARFKKANPALPLVLGTARYARALWFGKRVFGRTMPKARMAIVGDPRFWRIPKRLRRQILGLAKPVLCPTCRMPTRQRVMQIAGPTAHVCIPCGTAFTIDGLLVRKSNGEIIARRKVLPEAWAELVKATPRGVKVRIA